MRFPWVTPFGDGLSSAGSGKQTHVSLLPVSASYAELVSECFLAHRGTGLMLSPLDVELIGQWQSRGIPFEIVARGIRRAAESALFHAVPGEAPLRSLRACRKQVEAEYRRYAGRAAGKTEPAAEEAEPAHATRHQKLRAALKKMAKAHPGLAAFVERQLQGPLQALPADLAELGRLEERLEVLLVRALPFEERLRLLREARQMAQNAAPMSKRARQMSRRFLRSAALQRRLALTSLW